MKDINFNKYMEGNKECIIYNQLGVYLYNYSNNCSIEELLLNHSLKQPYFNSKDYYNYMIAYYNQLKNDKKGFNAFIDNLIWANGLNELKKVFEVKTKKELKNKIFKLISEVKK